MACCAVYRLPNEEACTLVVQSEGAPRLFDACEDLCGKSGFVISPFAVGTGTPLLMLCPDRVETFGNVGQIAVNVGDEVNEICAGCRLSAGNNIAGLAKGSYRPDPDISDNGPEQARQAYGDDFRKYHARLNDGSFSKIVLARCATDTLQHDVAPFVLFKRACMRYPRMFVALFSTPVSGTWLMATPEVLLENTSGNRWHTMALAGTMKLEGEALRFDVPVGNGNSGMAAANIPVWNDKNIQEQRYVATYIKQCVAHFADDITEEGPYTKRAGNVVHLRSDFYFTLDGGVPLGKLIGMLHPTPAVCGLPKDETFGFIVDNEHYPREYYSGFAGPMGIGGQTHLYVSLRCMRIVGATHYRLYAGGGLLRDSEEQSEWNETEAKMETMRQILKDANNEL